ncbi:hypothetical protein DL96DRAFT_1477613 [Flagelloscypha sp. PMI_526]|nr:hypothetical protein DL96DRAFT_1477613 [Flagelloscypha sp. PMI_526]
MVRGHPLSNDLRLALVTMCRSMSTQEAASLTGVPKRTIQRVLNEYQIRHTHLRPNLLGEFLRGLVRHRPDLYLNELRVLLEDRIGVSVSESTIWKALNKAGYTIKRVSFVGFSEVFTYFCSRSPALLLNAMRPFGLSIDMTGEFTTLQSKPSLLMSRHLIVGLPHGFMVGAQREDVLKRSVFLFKENGEPFSLIV